MDALRTLRLPQNRGKGYAVRAGVLVARGDHMGAPGGGENGMACQCRGVSLRAESLPEWHGGLKSIHSTHRSGQNILLMDADGATRVSDLERLESAAQDVMQQGDLGWGVGLGLGQPEPLAVLLRAVLRASRRVTAVLSPLPG